MSSERYWRERAERMLLDEERKGADLIRALTGFYSNTGSRLQADMDAFYLRYAKDNKISLESARRLLAPNEQESFQQALSHYRSTSQRLGFGKEHENYLRLLAGRASITRQQALHTQARQRVEALFRDGEAAFSSTLQSVYTGSYQAAGRELGISGDFARMDTQTVERLLRTPWLGENYSSRLWKHKTMLVEQLEELIPRAFATGENSRVLGQQLAERLSVSLSAGERLARTEVNRAANESARLAYHTAGVDKYEYLATLDRRTSEVCASLDGKTFLVSDAQAGRNYPPMHPNCRSTTIPYFASDEFDGEYTRAARKADGSHYTVSSSMNYDQWKKTPESGILEQISLDPIVITDLVIDALTTPAVPGWSKEQNAMLNERHRELLRLAKEQPLGNEVGMYMNEQLEGVVSAVGGTGQVKIDLSQGAVYMHNHPSGHLFTLNDLECILFNDNIQVLTAVGNQGHIYMLAKNKNFNFTDIRAVYTNVIKGHPDYKKAPEQYVQFMQAFLQELQPHGLIYLEG